MRCETPGCGSYAINPTLKGREEGLDENLCDVCYWRKRATEKDLVIMELQCKIECLTPGERSCKGCFRENNPSWRCEVCRREKPDFFVAN